VKPRVAVAPVKPTPRAANPLPPPVDVRPTAPAAPPAVALTVPRAPPAPPGPLVPTASFERLPSTIQPAPLAAPATTSSPWPLLALLAALAAATAAAYHWRRRAQIARTRAALNLNPRLDLTAGACSTSRLSFAAPPMSIRARLAHD
ncbi:MAG: hypothetical protein ABIQ32_05235, partial [Sphingomicrobium sp.]